MFKIAENSQQRLVILTPNTIHKFQAVLFIILGLLPTIGIALDDETVIFAAIVPLLLFITGVIFLFVGGKPDELVVDKTNHRVEVLMRKGSFSKDSPRIYQLDEIASSSVEKASRVSTYSGSSGRTAGIVLHLKSGETVQATVYTNRRKKVAELYNTVQLALGK